MKTSSNIAAESLSAELQTIFLFADATNSKHRNFQLTKAIQKPMECYQNQPASKDLEDTHRAKLRKF